MNGEEFVKKIKAGEIKDEDAAKIIDDLLSSVDMMMEGKRGRDLWQVVGDHPVLARPDKIFANQIEAYGYAATLKTLGYENIKITPPPPRLPVSS